MSGGLKERYEEMRQQCLSWANLRGSDAACHQAIERIPMRMPCFVAELALLCDDQALALQTVEAKLEDFRMFVAAALGSK